MEHMRVDEHADTQPYGADKRPQVDEQADTQPHGAGFNARVLRKLQKALAANPQTDLLSIFPINYSARLKRMKDQNAVNIIPAVNATSATAKPKPTINQQLASLVSGTTKVVFPLSESVRDLLQVGTHDKRVIQPQFLSIKLSNMIESSEVIWKSETCSGCAVIRCSEKIVAKIVPEINDYTEYTSMQYLEEHAPEIPAPRPLGLLVSKTTSYIFMSFVPGLTVNKIWPKASHEQKISISNQIGEVLLKLRQINVPDGVSLGGVCGEGCKDARRHTRISQERISTCAAFEDFQFSNPYYGGADYISLLRGLLSSHTAAIVFTHGDIRPENIVFQPDQHGNYLLAGIIDWEQSGFYPDYFECTKATNNMTNTSNDDWYSHLPMCASPKTYPLNWLVDRLWDPHVV